MILLMSGLFFNINKQKEIIISMCSIVIHLSKNCIKTSISNYRLKLSTSTVSTYQDIRKISEEVQRDELQEKSPQADVVMSDHVDPPALSSTSLENPFAEVRYKLFQTISFCIDLFIK